MKVAILTFYVKSGGCPIFLQDSSSKVHIVNKIIWPAVMKFCVVTWVCSASAFRTAPTTPCWGVGRTILCTPSCQVRLVTTTTNNTCPKVDANKKCAHNQHNHNEYRSSYNGHSVWDEIHFVHRLWDARFVVYRHSSWNYGFIANLEFNSFLVKFNLAEFWHAIQRVCSTAREKRTSKYGIPAWY